MESDNRRIMPLPRVPTGVPGLDDVLGGGLPANFLYLIEGDSGAGKTTLALQFLLEGKRRGEKTLWCSLSETQDEIVRTAGTHGWDLSGIELCNLSRDQERLEGEDQYTFFSPADIELGDVTQAVREVVERVRPARLVFDPFSDVRLLARDSLRHRRQVLAFREFFTGRGCTVLLLQELSRGGGQSPDDTAEGVVQGVITLSQSTPEYGGQRRRLNVHKLRGVAYRDGLHDLSIETGGMVVYPRLVASQHVATSPAETISSNVPELDSLLGGGFDRGTSLLAMGPAGVGKSTLASQFVVSAVGRGQRAAVFLFDETTKAFLARSEGLGMGLREGYESGQVSVHQIETAEFSPGEFASLVRRTVEAEGASLIVIDSMSGYLTGMPSENSLTMHLHELLSYLSYRNVCTVLTLNEHGIINQVPRAAVDVSYLADTVVLLRYFEASGKVHRAISVVKRRVGPHEETIREMRISPPGIHVGSPLESFRGVLTGQPQFVGRPSELGPEEVSSAGGGSE